MNDDDIEKERKRTMSKSKTWAGTFTFLRTVGFSQAAGRMKHGFTGTADVYAFEPADKKCKVAYAAVVRGVSLEAMCGSSGDVGAAVLRSAGLCDKAKNSGVAGEYDTFPDPIGRPVDKLQRSESAQALTFYRRK